MLNNLDSLYTFSLSKTETNPLLSDFIVTIPSFVRNCLMCINSFFIMLQSKGVF